jgi:hypothetical protein
MCEVSIAAPHTRDHPLFVKVSSPGESSTRKVRQFVSDGDLQSVSSNRLTSGGPVWPVWIEIHTTAVAWNLLHAINGNLLRVAPLPKPTGHTAPRKQEPVLHDRRSSVRLTAGPWRGMV